MKTKVLFLSVVVAICTSLNVDAQIFKQLENAVTQKAENAFGTVLNGKRAKTGNQNSGKRTGIFSNAGQDYDFVAGTQILYGDNFNADPLGSMPPHWKTNGSASIVNFPNQNGKWMQLRNFTSYKLKSNESLPENFTIEFDIVTDSETDVTAFGNLAFGFAHNNNISSFIGDAYNEGAITNTQIFYANGEITSMSSDTQINNDTNFPLQGYAIGRMHVAIAVHGTNMRVFLDKVKVMDAQMFSRSNEAKYFYISTATNMHNNARIAVGNFKIAS